MNADKDLTIANLATPRELGDSKVSGSWIWQVIVEPESAPKTKKRQTKADKAAAKAADRRKCSSLAHLCPCSSFGRRVQAVAARPL